jgi:hypothetical protein
MTKSEITRLLAMIAHEDVKPDTFMFVVNRIFGAFQAQESNK